MRNESRRIWVVFTGKTDIWYLKFLKKEFRHCFVILDDNSHWITIDPLSSHTEVEIVSKKNKKQTLPKWFLECGFTVIETQFFDPLFKSAPLSFLNCVESIKKIIGIHSFGILTPYQLFKYLQKKNRKDIKHGKYI